MENYWRYLSWVVCALLLAGTTRADMMLKNQKFNNPAPWAKNSRSDAYQQTSAQYSPAVPLTYENVKPQGVVYPKVAAVIPGSYQWYETPAGTQYSPPADQYPKYVYPFYYAPSYAYKAAPVQYVPAEYELVKPKNAVSVHYEAAPANGESYGYSYSYPTTKKSNEFVTAKGMPVYKTAYPTGYYWGKSYPELSKVYAY